MRTKYRTLLLRRHNCWPISGPRWSNGNAYENVTLSVATRDDINRRALSAFEGNQEGAHISFSSVDLLWQTMTRKRWELLKAMAGQDAMSIRAAARRVGRDVKTVHGDVHALLDAGILDRADDGRIMFPFDAVHVDFTLTAVA